MMLAFHILLKDLRRHWWEIALYIASVFGWAWQHAHPNPWIASNASELFPVAMFVVWFLLAIRVIHSEPLTGTRDFWLTRPYPAGQLLFAKFAFLLLCIHLPLTLAQCWLLKNAGFVIDRTVAGQLALLQLEFFLLLTFPAAALAAITDNLVQWVLVIIGGLLFALVVSWLPWDSFTPALAGTERVADTVGFIVIACLLLGLVLWQYNRRRPAPARILFAVAVVLVPIFAALASTRLARLTAYRPAPAAPLSLTMPSVPQREYLRSDYSEGLSGIQFSVTGNAAPGTAAAIEGARFRVNAAGGSVYESNWIHENSVFTPENQTTMLGFSLPTSAADRIAHGGAQISAELAVAVYQLTPPHRTDTSTKTFSVAGMGSCTWDERFGTIARYHYLNCEMPMRVPDLYTIEVDSGEYTCPAHTQEAPVPPGHRASQVIVEGSPLPIDLSPDPIRIFTPMVGTWEPGIVANTKEGTSLRSGNICPGTPFTVRTGTLVRRTIVTVPLGDLGKETRTGIEQQTAQPPGPK